MQDCSKCRVGVMILHEGDPREADAINRVPTLLGAEAPDAGPDGFSQSRRRDQLQLVR